MSLKEIINPLIPTFYRQAAPRSRREKGLIGGCHLGTGSFTGEAFKRSHDEKFTLACTVHSMVNTVQINL